VKISEPPPSSSLTELYKNVQYVTKYLEPNNRFMKFYNTIYGLNFANVSDFRAFYFIQTY